MAVRELASVDGRIFPTEQAMVPLSDDGLYRGDGVFEVIRLYGGRPFALDEHLARLERSGAAIELAVDRARLEPEIEALLAELGPEDAQLRIILTRGGRRLAMTEPLPPRGETIRLASVTYSPNGVLTGVKSLSYAANMHATRVAQAADADEAVFVRPDGVVLEAPTSAIFWATEAGELRTPSLEAGILDSITRAHIVRELDVREGEYELGDLLRASEAFLASTTREVQPVAAVDGHELAAPGPRTADAAATFARVLAAALPD